MSTPDEVVQAQLGAVAAASAPAPLQPLDLSQARAVEVDAQALLAQLQELTAKAQAREDAANPPPEPADDSLHVDGNAPSYLHDVVAKIEKRLTAAGV